MKIWNLAGIAVLLAAAAAPVWSGVLYVAGAGEPAIGFPEDYIYWDVGNPVIGEGGHIAFTGAADTSLSQTNDYTPAVWFGFPDQIERVLAQGDMIAGLPASVLYSGAIQSPPIVSKSGNLAMLVFLQGAVAQNSTDRALVARVDGSFENVLRLGDPAPGHAAGALVSGISTFALSDAGIAIIGSVAQSGFTAGFAVWFWDYENMHLIASSLVDLGERPSGPGCDFGAFYGVELNDAGDLVFTVFPAGECPTVLMRWKAGVYSSVLDLLSPVPGMTDTEFQGAFAVLGNAFFDLNRQGDVVFMNTVTRTASPFGSAFSGWVRKANGDLELTLMGGESIKGEPHKLIPTSVNLTRPSLGDSARSAMFLSTVTGELILAGGTRGGQPYDMLPVSGESQLDKLAQVGDVPPGLANTFFYESLGHPVMNQAGQASFYARWKDALAPAVDIEGVWRESPVDGSLATALKTGDLVSVNGTAKTITRVDDLSRSGSFDYAGNGGNGLSSRVNAAGEMLIEGAVSGTFVDHIFFYPWESQIADYDEDGVPDDQDAFPCDPEESEDTDGDGVGDNADEYPEGQFQDVPTGYWALAAIEAFARFGITQGCGAGVYCPFSQVTRAEMAIFLERALRGGDYVPPPATGTVFSDVPVGSFGAAFIEQLFRDGVTNGCNAGLFCPGASVTRAEMAVFIIRLLEGSGYVPPTPQGLFSDVPQGFWAEGWIEELAARGVTQGCDTGKFCPGGWVTRDQMAMFLVRALDLWPADGGFCPVEE